MSEIQYNKYVLCWFDWIFGWLRSFVEVEPEFVLDPRVGLRALLACVQVPAIVRISNNNNNNNNNNYLHVYKYRSLLSSREKSLQTLGMLQACRIVIIMIMM